jgi:hypothetical protein
VDSGLPRVRYETLLSASFFVCPIHQTPLSSQVGNPFFFCFALHRPKSILILAPMNLSLRANLLLFPQVSSDHLVYSLQISLIVFRVLVLYGELLACLAACMCIALEYMYTRLHGLPSLQNPPGRYDHKLLFCFLLTFSRGGSFLPHHHQHGSKMVSSVIFLYLHCFN